MFIDIDASFLSFVGLYTSGTTVAITINHNLLVKLELVGGLNPSEKY